MNHFCIPLNGSKFSKWLNSSIWPLDGTLTDTTTLSQRGSGTNDTEEVLHIPPKL